MEKQLETLKTRDIAEISWKDFGEVIIAESLEEAVEYANDYAPEHLEVNVEEEFKEKVISSLRNYGSLFIGRKYGGSIWRLCFRDESYASYSRGCQIYRRSMGRNFYEDMYISGDDNRRNEKKIAPLVSNLAEGEGLAGHARAAEIRIEKAASDNISK